MEVGSGVDDTCLVLLDFESSEFRKLPQTAMRLLMWPLTAGQQ